MWSYPTNGKTLDDEMKGKCSISDKKLNITESKEHKELQYIHSCV